MVVIIILFVSHKCGQFREKALGLGNHMTLAYIKQVKCLSQFFSVVCSVARRCRVELSTLPDRLELLDNAFEHVKANDINLIR